jgi:hypothetical protein
MKFNFLVGCLRGMGVVLLILSDPSNTFALFLIVFISVVLLGFDTKE